MRIALLWAIGFSTRVTLLAVPPLLPALHRDLVLDETAVGALTALPIVILSLGAVAGSFVIASTGPRLGAIAGLALVAVAGVARVAGPSVQMLFAATVVMGIGVTVTQVATPSLVAAWAPRQIGRATATYGNGILIGEIAGAALTATLVLTLLGTWQIALALWSLPVLMVAVALLSEPEAPAQAEPARWWPEWRDGRVWTIGLALGAASLAYWGSNAHLPDYLHASGHGDDVALALASLNLMQLGSSALMGLWPAAFVGRRWPFVLAGAVITAAALGMMVTGGAASGVWAGATGLSSALVFLIALALPPMLAAPGDVHRFSAGVFTISYACAFIGPVVAGAMWDATHTPAMALVPTAASGLLLIVTGSRMALRRSSA